MRGCALITTVLLPLAALSLSIQGPLSDPKPPETCDCTGIEATTINASWHICNNASLGPITLPWRFPLLSFVSNYDRMGDLTPREFLDKWRDPKTGFWIYPPHDGFQLDTDGKPIKGNMTLKKGFKVDRFGYERGRYVSAADAPFAQRALPPDALNICTDTSKICNPKDQPWAYHVYEVMRDFEVVGGPIAPAFEQPGLGAQFYVGNTGRVSELVDKGILRRMSLSEVTPGPGEAGGCGRNPVNCACEPPK